jgi:hypothetical protein
MSLLCPAPVTLSCVALAPSYPHVPCVQLGSPEKPFPSQSFARLRHHDVPPQ